MAAEDVDAHLARFEDPQRATLQTMRELALRVLPGAQEGIAWGMPCLFVDGDKVICLEGFRHHNSVFPMDGQTMAAFHEEFPQYQVTKGTVHFALDSPMPAGHLRRLLDLRLQSINNSYPKKSGETKEFYSNGRLKAKGKMRDGQLQGRWEWFRRDGSRKRSGQFRGGRKVGTWTTYTADGAAHTITEY